MNTETEELHSMIALAEDIFDSIDEEKSNIVPGSKWRLKEILGHLIDSACNNHQRIIRLQDGNLIGFPVYNQNQWVERAGYRNMKWDNLKDLWRSYNTILAGIIYNIDDSSLHNFWEEKEMSLEHLVKEYIRHAEHHLHQIKNAV